MEKLYLGIDIGSTTFKAVLLNERGKVRQIGRASCRERVFLTV